MPGWLRPSLNWLLPVVPVTIGLEFLAPERHALIFVLACVGIIPLAGWMGRATEELADRSGAAVGGLLNATFGNMAELIIALMALRAGLVDVVKASLTGSIIGNILLVLGAAFLGGGLRFKRQQFNPTGSRIQATMLTLAAVALVLPAAYHHLVGPAGLPREGSLSVAIAIVLLVTYGLGLLFSLHTHKPLFSGDVVETAQLEHAKHAPWPLKTALGLLAGATALVAWLSEILVGAVEPAAATFGMTNLFIGVVVVAIIGNAAEHSTAILVALKNRMDLSIGIAIGSSVQVALFVAPIVLLASYVIGPVPMDLVFTPAEVLAIGLAVIITGQIAEDGESNWMEGVLLLAVYLILAIVFYFLPESAGTV
ncbi:MAG: calcium/proton exchanger [Gemmatimonadota bacterium]